MIKYDCSVETISGTALPATSLLDFPSIIDGQTLFTVNWAHAKPEYCDPVTFTILVKDMNNSNAVVPNAMSISTTGVITVD